jgi:hypothetical protein
MEKTAVSARPEKLREHTRGWPEEAVPSVRCCRPLIGISQLIRTNDPELWFSLFMDRHWRAFQRELPNWFCADEQQRQNN